MKKFFYNLMENKDSTMRAWFDAIIMIVILASIISFLVGLSSPEIAANLESFDAAVLVVFIVEYLLRFWLASDVGSDFRKGYRRYRRRGFITACCQGIKKAIASKIRFMIQLMAIIDLLAILPFMRIFRMFRLLRLLRLLKVVRYSRSMENLLLVFKDNAFEFMMVVTVLLFILIFSASTIYVVEKIDVKKTEAQGKPVENNRINSLGTAFWWSVVTLTSVGYGDLYPYTAVGKVVGGIVMILGIGVCALPAGIIAAGLSERIRKLKEGLTTMKSMSNHIVICGWSNMAMHMLDELKKTMIYRNHEVVVVSQNSNIEYPGLHFLRGDYTKETVLQRAGVANAYCAIILAEKGSDQSENTDARSVLTAFLLDKNMPEPATMMVEIIHKENAGVLHSRLPRAHIIISDEVTGNLLNNAIINPTIGEIVLELISQRSNNFCQVAFTEIKDIAPQVNNFQDLFGYFRSEDLPGIPMAIEREGKVIVNPVNQYQLQSGDIIFYIAQEVH